MKEFEEKLFSRQKQADYDYTVGHMIAHNTIRWYLSRQLIREGWCLNHTSEALGLDFEYILAACALGTETDALGLSLLKEFLYDIIIACYGDDMPMERIEEIVEDESIVIKEMLLMSDGQNCPVRF